MFKEVTRLFCFSLLNETITHAAQHYKFGYHYIFLFPLKSFILEIVPNELWMFQIQLGLTHHCFSLSS